MNICLAKKKTITLFINAIIMVEIVTLSLTRFSKMHDLKWSSRFKSSHPRHLKFTTNKESKMIWVQNIKN